MPMKGQPARWIGTITLRNTWFSCQLRRFAEALLKHARPGQAVEKSPPGHTLPILKSYHATQDTVRFAVVKVLEDKGVEPESGGRAPESLDQESVEREDVQQESAKEAVSKAAGARLPLEAGSVGLGEDGHIQSAPANRPLAFRFAACGVQFEAELAGPIGGAHV